MFKEKAKGGLFVVSIDLELAWGSKGKGRYVEAYRQERKLITDFLALCEKYDIPCTWATVGNLFLRDKKEAEDFGIELLGRGKEIYRDVLKEGLYDNQLWFGEDIIKKILSCKTKQEIGCHTFFHSLRHETNEEDYKKELIQSSRIAREKFGIDLVSFVFPKNDCGYFGALSGSGRTSFRGMDKLRSFSSLPILKQLGNAFDAYVGLPALEIFPQKDQSGLFNIAGSYFYPTILRGGVVPPMFSRIRKVMGGIRNAIKHGGVCHIWFHPHNISLNSKYWLAGLEKIFARVAEERKRSNIQTVTMGQVADMMK